MNECMNVFFFCEFEMHSAQMCIKFSVVEFAVVSFLPISVLSSIKRIVNAGGNRLIRIVHVHPQV